MTITGWRLHPAEGDLHRRFFEHGFDDAWWEDAPVPGHWRAVADVDGPVLYRARFGGERPAPGRRRFVVFDGIFYYADVWLDSAYLGATEGYFSPHAFEIPPGGPDEHVLAVEVSCPPQRDRTEKRLITGVFSHWDCLDPGWNPGGLWRPVRVVETGPVRIAALRVVCTEATEERGRLRLDLTLDAGAGTESPLPVRLVARLTGAGLAVDTDHETTLAAGVNHHTWVIDVDAPPRWWPRRLGDQTLCDLELGVEVGGEESDVRIVRTGFREVRLDNWTFHVNGERLYVMGSNQGPTRMALGDATEEEIGRDVELATTANLDMLRVHGHVARPELYRAADEAGLLLWQDFPLQWAYARGIRRQAAAQARQMVDLLGHHPSIAMWCAHNEPLAVDLEPGQPIRPGQVIRAGLGVVAPTWNKNVLDRSVRRAIQKADGTRPVDPHSGIPPGPSGGGTDSHLYFGWYHGRVADLGPALRRWPRLARFVSEFGAQAVPDDAAFMEPERWPDLDWDRLGRHHSLQHDLLDRHVPVAAGTSFDGWRRATQEYQADLVQLQVEDLRRVKYRPGGGFLHFMFADAHPAVTWSVLDHARTPKLAYEALRDACRPVLPVVDLRTGDVHVISELRRPLAGAVVEVAAPGRRWRWSGPVAADGVTFVGRVEPPALGDLSVVLEHPAVGDVRNEYRRALLDRVGGSTG